jgi:hypothetical protein
LPRCLVLSGGFAVNDRRHRHLDQQARRLGFADLRACLQALLDDGWSVPQQRATAQAAELGFDNVRAYLVDRLVTRAWTLTQVQGEPGAAPAAVHEAEGARSGDRRGARAPSVSRATASVRASHGRLVPAARPGDHGAHADLRGAARPGASADSR